MAPAPRRQIGAVAQRAEELVVEDCAIGYEMEPLTKNNFAFWESYATAMRALAYNADQFNEEKKSAWGNAVKGFLDALAEFKKKKKGAQVWIAQAIQKGKKDKDLTPLQKMVRIEMCMTVTTGDGVPFVTHMGIFRTPLRELTPESIEALKKVAFKGVNVIVAEAAKPGLKLEVAKGISLDLHAFAARQILEIYKDEKIYMITAPLKVMMEIMEKKFGESTITTEEGVDDFTVTVNKDEPLKISKKVWETESWIETLADLGGDRPKVAYKLVDMVK